MRKVTFIMALVMFLFGACACNDSEPQTDKEPGQEQEDPKPSDEDLERLNYWKKEANNSTISFVKLFWNSDKHFFNTYAGKPDTSAQDWCYWPQAHAMDVVIDAYMRSGNKSWKSYFDAWYVGVKQKSGGSYYNDFVDDMEWICLTMIRLYEATGEKKYINTARDLWNVIKSNWNEDYADGGISWKQSQPWSKNSCSNGPAGIIAARLYQIDGKKAEDLEWAKKIFQWQTKTLVNTQTGAVYDHYDGKEDFTQKNWLFTYNQGTYMGMAHELYNITGQSEYLSYAKKAATFCIENLINSDKGILKNEGTGDGGLFKAVFVRYFVKLVLEEDLLPREREKFVTFFNRNAEILNSHGTGDDYLYAGDWSQPGNRTNYDMPTQVSGCTMIEAKAHYEIEIAKRNK